MWDVIDFCRALRYHQIELETTHLAIDWPFPDSLGKTPTPPILLMDRETESVSISTEVFVQKPTPLADNGLAMQRDSRNDPGQNRRRNDHCLCVYVYPSVDCVRGRTGGREIGWHCLPASRRSDGENTGKQDNFCNGIRSPTDPAEGFNLPRKRQTTVAFGGILRRGVSPATIGRIVFALLSIYGGVTVRCSSLRSLSPPVSHLVIAPSWQRQLAVISMTGSAGETHRENVEVVCIDRPRESRETRHKTANIRRVEFEPVYNEQLRQ